MSTKTTNYGLTKQAAEEYYNVEIPNANMDIIDTTMKGLESGKEATLKSATEKTALADADALPLIDSTDSSKTKKLTFANLKILLKSIFATTDDISTLNTSLSGLSTTENITYYVSTTGLDTNDGLTSGTAFKTIQHALDILPRRVTHTVTINVSAGTFSEDLKIYAASGNGIINIIGNSSITTFIKSITNYFSGYLVNIQKCDIQTFTAKSGHAILTNCASVGNVAYGVVADGVSVIEIVSTSISNKTTYAMLARYGGNITMVQVTGSNNAIALASQYSGRICKGWGNTITGTTQEQKMYGGEVIEDTGIPTGVLPLIGGTLSGNLLIQKDNPVLKLYNTARNNRQITITEDVFDTASFMNTDIAGTNGGCLSVLSEAAALTDRVQFVKFVSGVSTSYKIYGEHNITCSTSAPGSALAEGVQHQVY